MIPIGFRTTASIADNFKRSLNTTGAGRNLSILTTLRAWMEKP
jgi:hypothetical protein